MFVIKYLHLKHTKKPTEVLNDCLMFSTAIERIEGSVNDHCFFSISREDKLYKKTSKFAWISVNIRTEKFISAPIWAC